MNNKNKDVGALSNLDFSHVVNAAKLVKSGKVYDLGNELSKEMPTLGPEYFLPFSLIQYRIPEDWDNRTNLANVLPSLFVSAGVAGNLLVVRTVNGGAAAVAYAIDWEDWPEVMGTVAGEATVFVAVSDEGKIGVVHDRLLHIVSVEKA